MSLLISPSGALAQTPVAPSVERADIEILRGTDIVQPPTVFYKRVQDGEDAALVPGDSVGVLQVPRASELDAIGYNDRFLGFAVNVQHAMIVVDGQVVDVQVSTAVAHNTRDSSIQQELFLIRPPAEDAFDIALPDGLPCKRLAPNSEEDRRTRGRLYGDTPCKQVPGIETVIDVAAWYDASLTNSMSGAMARPGPAHNARELRGWLRSLAPGGEQIRFGIIVTPPPVQLAIGPAAVRMDTVMLAPTFTFEGNIRVDEVAPSGFEWITTVGALQGPNRSDLPGRPGADRYQANRLKGDVTTTLRWRASEEQRYDLTLFGSTQPTFSSRAPGNHHDVPYGARITARFGERDDYGMALQLQGGFEDDAFQRNTLLDGDQRIQLLAGLDRGALSETDPRWRLSVGPTYFVDRANIWEGRSATRQLGYTVDGAFNRLLQLKRIPTLFDARAQWSQSWGYISDTGNNNLDLQIRLSAKPRLQFANTVLAAGPVLYLGHTHSDYATLRSVTENNLQFGLEVQSAIQF